MDVSEAGLVDFAAGLGVGLLRADEIDFRTLFEVLPSPYMILDRDFRYVEVNTAYLETLGRTREALIGVGLFEAFPSSGESERMLRGSFERVLATGRRDVLALIPYPIERPAARGGGLEMRYWSAVHTPLFGADGQVAFILQNTVDVTELQRLKEIAYGPGASPPAEGETTLLQRAEQMQQANRALLQEFTQLRDLFMQAPGFMAVLSGPDFVFRFVNNAYQQLIGDRPLIGLPVEHALPEVRTQGFLNLLQQAFHSREPVVGRAASLHLRRSPSAPLEERFIDFVYQPILGSDGAAEGVFVEGVDVTDRVLAERQQKLLLDELNHRVKNTLATVQSIAAQTHRSAPDPQAFRKAFEARLLALSATHDLLTASSWRGASLREVISLEFRPYGAERYRLEGPEVQLSAPEALALGLLFHELVTNAAKYGALSCAEGCVRVRWSVADGRLQLTWTEEGGPAVAPPKRQGFGSRLIERSLRGELGGRTELSFHPAGLTCRMEIPLQSPPTA
jgi:PAS domain S-box-containing protein